MPASGVPVPSRIERARNALERLAQPESKEPTRRKGTGCMYRLMADVVLLVHLAVVAFVVVGLAAILVGNWRGWSWVNLLAFRFLHAAAIGIVVLQAWLGQDCPLTTLESWLRSRAGEAAYAGGFIEQWVHRVLFYQAPTWIFAVLYSLFGAAVGAAWWIYPPRGKSSRP